jgi:UDP-glucose 4-epimerase
MTSGSDSKQRQLTLHRRIDPDARVVALTGANGFLGRALIERLEADRRYKRILAIDLTRPRMRTNKTTFIKVDLTQPTADADIATVVEKERVDTMVHLAFLSRPTHNAAWAHELEAIGTMHLLNACAACSLHKVIVWSLTALYGAHEDNPNYLAHDSPLRGMPGSRFFSDKLEAARLTERFARENPATVVTMLRTAPILGRKVNNWISRLVGAPMIPILLGYDPLVQLLGEEDAVGAFKTCVDADFHGAYSIAADGVLPLSTVIALAGRIPVPLPHFAARPLARSLWLAQLVDVPPSWLDFMRYACVADTRRSHDELAFRPTMDIRQVIRAFCEPEKRATAARKPKSLP